MHLSVLTVTIDMIFESDVTMFKAFLYEPSQTLLNFLNKSTFSLSSLCLYFFILLGMRQQNQKSLAWDAFGSFWLGSLALWFKYQDLRKDLALEKNYLDFVCSINIKASWNH